MWNFFCIVSIYILHQIDSHHRLVRFLMLLIVIIGSHLQIIIWLLNMQLCVAYMSRPLVYTNAMPPVARAGVACSSGHTRWTYRALPRCFFVTVVLCFGWSVCHWLHMDSLLDVANYVCFAH
jgi:hypothetical protein